MAPHVFKWNEVNPETDFVYGQVKKGRDHDGFSVPLQVKDKNGQLHNFVHIGEEMAIPFGLKEKVTKFGSRFSCDMTFPNVTTNADGELQGPDNLVGYANFLFGIEKLNKEKCMENCVDWFGKEYKMDVIEEFFFKSIMESRQPEKYSPTFTTRIKHSPSKGFETKFYNQNGEPIKFEDIKAGSRLIPLLETTGLWFAGKSFGMSYKVLQVMVFEKEEFDSCVIKNPYAPAVPEAPEGSIDPSFNMPDKRPGSPVDQGGKRAKIDA